MRRYKQARLQCAMKLIDAAQNLGVAQPTLSAWEGERNEPSIDTVKKMAKLYGVSIEYLVGEDSFEFLSRSERIPLASVPIFHGKPVWVVGRGWALVNAYEHKLIGVDGSSQPIGENTELLFAAPAYNEPETRTDPPLSWDELHTQDVVWVEPISTDRKLREMLRGRYSVKEQFVENYRGNRFWMDGYMAEWIAYHVD